MLAALITHALDGKSAARADRLDTAKVFEALDGGGKGFLTVDDLQAAVVNISAAGARRAQAPGVEKRFARLDSDGDGQLSRQEFEAALPRGLRAGHGKKAGAVDGDVPAAAPSTAPADAAAQATQAYASVAQLGQDAAAV